MPHITRSTRWHLLVVLLCVLLLDSCAITPTPTPIPTEKVETGPAAAEASYPPNLRGAQLYRVDATASSIHILVYRGGPMAKVGHNHVISSTKLSGYIWRDSTLDDSGFNFVVPVNELVVDDDDARKAEGAEFPLNVADAAKQDTKHNMLSEALLDGAHFPLVAIKSIGMSGAMDAPQVRVALHIKTQTREVTVPVAIEVRDDQLAVRGEFKILQSDFGIAPFSVAMGALSVVDSVTIKFDLVARQADASH